MTQEEKAKAYDEAIERAREWAETKNGYYTPKELCEEIFLELHESEDEKVEKAIFGMVYDSDNELWSSYDVSKSDVLAWLEKQELNSNPYSGVSFSYNGNIWGMCARDNGVDILFNKKLIQHISGDK